MKVFHSRKYLGYEETLRDLPTRDEWANYELDTDVDTLNSEWFVTIINIGLEDVSFAVSGLSKPEGYSESE